MRKPIDLTGQQCGRLLVMERTGSDKRRNALWLCQCECGERVTVRACDLKSGHTESCGCLKRERQRASVTTHGAAETRLYHIWEGMKSRCMNGSDRSYKDYGGRGITVCAEWENSFEAFRDWALENGYRDNLTIDRENNDGPYSPNNCRWATAKQQGNNRRSNRMIAHNGETHTLTQWAELTGIKYEALCQRLRNGWSVERALTTKPKGATP